MEKLIELLNEYDGDVLEYWFVDEDIRRKVKNFDNEKNTWKSVVWYTKQFWFIKWLVENEKIDFKKLENLNKFNDILYLRTAYYGLLMLLSIQDNPIEFLVSILK
jgi:hypothetical protein